MITKNKQTLLRLGLGHEHEMLRFMCFPKFFSVIHETREGKAKNGDNRY